ncbi:hypothetical protein [Hydrogenophaga sp. 5NK40-0174]|uniref:hypothetical protein n=1 Tax=Hydrogenophaga sp. 5NK40-0174 TaxID=3127649 RepID=UPI0031090A2A
MLKVARLVDGKAVPLETPAVFCRETTAASTERLTSCVPGGDVGLLLALMKVLEPPFFLLYILHTPRGEGEPGRYQSPSVSAEVAEDFVSRFGDYLGADARFDFWVHSPSSQATIVWDRHNQLFAYGPLERFEAVFLSRGFSEGLLPALGTHVHEYRSEFDTQAKSVLDAFEWIRTPLRPEDEQ